jgi:hypothetical protein
VRVMYYRVPVTKVVVLGRMQYVLGEGRRFANVNYISS